MQDQSIYIDGLKINYKIGGAGVPILILHGWESSSDKWQKVGEFLVQNNFLVIIPDLPGFGKSSLPPIPWTVSDYLELVVKFVEKLYAKNDISGHFFLLGHSFGGRIAIKFGAVYPEKISGFILCSAGGIISKKRAKVKFFYLLTKSGKIFFSLPILRGTQNFVRKALYRLAGTRDYLRASPLMRETMKKIISENLIPYLSKIKISTLIIWGAKDKILPLGDARIIKEKIQNSTLEIIPNVGHAPNLEAPEMLSKIVLNWLQKEK